MKTNLKMTCPACGASGKAKVDEDDVKWADIDTHDSGGSVMVRCFCCGKQIELMVHETRKLMLDEAHTV